MEEQKSNTLLEPLKTKSELSLLPSYTYTKSLQEAPYTALVGVVIDGRETKRHSQHPRYRIRNQTGLTNRWRLPESLYSDMLGTSQALKAVNMPFDRNLLTSLGRTYPNINPMLNMCQDISEVNERNWSLLKKAKQYKPITEEDEIENKTGKNSAAT